MSPSLHKLLSLEKKKEKQNNNKKQQTNKQSKWTLYIVSFRPK